MLATTLPFLALLIGVCGLIFGADRFVNGSAGTAKNFGISPLVIGLTVVSIGTSAPEIIVSISAALRDASALAVGNAIGSNLANIGLVLGVTLLIAPLPVQRHLIVEEGPALLLVTLLAGVILFNNTLGRAESIALMLLAIPLLFATIKYKKHHPDSELIEEGENRPTLSTSTAVIALSFGLAVLLASAELTVWGATEIASRLGVSELIVGLTVVAIGTSLPELAASVASALKGHTDIALGNVLGSNLFNLMLVMTAAGIIQPSTLDSAVFTRDFASMAAITLLLVIAIAWALRRGGALTKPLGVLFLLCYAGYYASLTPALMQ
ncbi:calcium/sodium antiporter [Porticoccaceae bacterium]|nr:calcium/sodium antiporter [Porticoccaceae bacterium]